MTSMLISGCGETNAVEGAVDCVSEDYVMQVFREIKTEKNCLELQMGHWS